MTLGAARDAVGHDAHVNRQPLPDTGAVLHHGVWCKDTDVSRNMGEAMLLDLALSRLIRQGRLTVQYPDGKQTEVLDCGQHFGQRR